MQDDENVILFPSRVTANTHDRFRKGLAAIKVLMDFPARQAFETIDNWFDNGLITDDERTALHQFYGVIE